MIRSTPSPVKQGCWRREIAVPWKDAFAVVELGLWSMLSMADVVKTLLRIFGEHITCSLWNCLQALFSIWAESSITRVYEMLMLRCDNLSTNSLFRVWACNIIPTCVGTGVSCAALWIADSSHVVGCALLCFIQINFSIWQWQMRQGLCLPSDP